MALANYVPTEWVDGTTPAIDATNLNHIEQSLKNVTDQALANEQSLLEVMPVGAIIMWKGPLIPSGWALFTEMDNRFPMNTTSSGEVGQTGGSADSVAAHSHDDTFAIANDSHSHEFGRYALESQVQFAQGAVYGVEGTATDVNTESDTHNHGITGGVSSEGINDGNLPPFYRLMFIIKV